MLTVPVRSWSSLAKSWAISSAVSAYLPSTTSERLGCKVHHFEYIIPRFCVILIHNSSFLCTFDTQFLVLNTKFIIFAPAGAGCRAGSSAGPTPCNHSRDLSIAGMCIQCRSDSANPPVEVAIDARAQRSAALVPEDVTRALDAVAGARGSGRIVAADAVGGVVDAKERVPQAEAAAHALMHERIFGRRGDALARHGPYRPIHPVARLQTFIILNTQPLVFDTQFLVWNTKFLVFNKKFISFTHTEEVGIGRWDGGHGIVVDLRQNRPNQSQNSRKTVVKQSQNGCKTVEINSNRTGSSNQARPSKQPSSLAMIVSPARCVAGLQAHAISERSPWKSVCGGDCACTYGGAGATSPAKFIILNTQFLVFV